MKHSDGNKRQIVVLDGTIEVKEIGLLKTSRVPFLCTSVIEHNGIKGYVSTSRLSIIISGSSAPIRIPDPLTDPQPRLESDFG